MSYLSLIWVPVVTGLIGWGTNWIAIKMLFKPQNPCFLFGIKLQGVIPRRKAILAKKIGEIIEKEMLCSHTIKSELNKVDLNDYMELLVKKLIREGLAKKLQAMPFLGGFINESTLEKLETMAKEALAEEMVNFKSVLSDEVEQHLKIQQIVESKIIAFNLAQVERMVMEAAGQEFKVIECLGGVLGFIIGLAQLFVLWACGNIQF